MAAPSISSPQQQAGAQNIYDTDDFFEQYCKYPRVTKGVEGASEWPRLHAMLPSLAGRRVLDLGCGDGWFARHAAQQGAASVRGCDISLNMLARARDVVCADQAILLSPSGRSRVSFTHMDLEDVNLGEETFDVVFSGLAMHYVANISVLLKRVHDSLSPGGVFVFSIEHPIFTAPIHPSFGRSHPGSHSSSTTTGSYGGGSGSNSGAEDEEGDVDRPERRAAASWYWPVDSYFTEGERVVRWLVDGVRKQHRTLGTYSRLLIEAGFDIREIDEWGGTTTSTTTTTTASSASGKDDEGDDEGRKHPDWPENVCPRFLLVAASKRGLGRE